MLKNYFIVALRRLRRIAWWIFAVTGAGTLIITLLTVSWTAIKAATANPVNALRSE